MAKLLPRDVASEVATAMRDGNNLSSLRALCKTYNEDELYKAMDCIPATPQYVEHLNAMKGEIEAIRHRQLTEHFESLKNKKHHWTLVPTFWLVFASAVIGLITLVVVYLAWRYPIEPPHAVPLSQGIPRISSNPISPNPQEKQKSQDISPLKPVPPTTNVIAPLASPKK